MSNMLLHMDVQVAAERAVAAAAAKERADIEASVSGLVADLQTRMAALASEVRARTTRPKRLPSRRRSSSACGTTCWRALSPMVMLHMWRRLCTEGVNCEPNINCTRGPPVMGRNSPPCVSA